jgi:hypothetical protein
VAGTEAAVFATAGAGAAAGAFCAAGAAGFARKKGTTPAWYTITRIMRLKIPPIIRQIASNMMPSIPLVSRPLAISQTMPISAKATNRAQITLSSIQLALGEAVSCLIVVVVIGPFYRKSSTQAEAECE